MHGARANLVKTCNRQSVTTAPSFGLVQYCWQAMGILHLPKISQTSALPEIIASMLQPTKTVARLSPPQWLPFPLSIPPKMVILQLKKQTSGGRWEKRPPFPLPIVSRALSFCLSPALYDTKRESQYPDNKLPLALTSLHRNGLELYKSLRFFWLFFIHLFFLFYSFQDGFILIKQTCCPCFRRRQYSQIP